MNTHLQASNLLRALAEYTGEQNLELREDEPLTLTLGGRFFTFVYDGETEELLSMAYVAPLPPLSAGQRREETLRDLLRGNYAWAGTDGGVLGLDKDSDWICLSRRCLPEQESPASFRAKVAHQAGLTDYWRHMLTADPRPEASEDFIRI
jgi:hypothetical protein